MSLSVQAVTKTFGAQTALEGVSLHAQPGEIVGFLGPNGAGKSTTMKIAMGYVSADQGTVQVAGHPAGSKAAKAKVGYLPEHNPLYLDMYVREYLRWSGKSYGMKGKALRQGIDRVIHDCGLQREAHKQLGSLSKGYRQRAGLAQALLHQPEVLILDEPTTGLDPNQIVEIRQLIKAQATDKTVVLSTHLMQEVQALCTRAVIINRGKVVADKPVSELQDMDARVEVEFAEEVDAHLLDGLPGLASAEQPSPRRFSLVPQPGHDLRPAVFALAKERGLTLLTLKQERQSLEDVFRHLTTPAHA